MLNQHSLLEIRLGELCYIKAWVICVYLVPVHELIRLNLFPVLADLGPQGYRPQKPGRSPSVSLWPVVRSDGTGVEMDKLCGSEVI